MTEPTTAIVFSASSDIGTAMCERWVAAGWRVAGTYRTDSAEVQALRDKGVSMVACDAADAASVRDACAELRRLAPSWDVMVNGIGTQEPVGPFAKTAFDEWEASIGVNFTAQMRMIHELLPNRNTGSANGPAVLLFAGGGTNNATVNYSAYTISKIALIKMCELLDAEVPDTRFFIVGPGWVKTKIHEATLVAGAELAGDNFEKTKEKLAGGELTPMSDVLDSCDWLIGQPREVVGGRNFSTVFDEWGSADLAEALARDPNMYKLRRAGNEWHS